MALTEDTERTSLAGRRRVTEVLEGVKIFAGALVVITALGYAKPAVTGTALRAIGICRKRVDNTDGDSGDVSVETDSGPFIFKNSEDADEITKADIGKPAWIVDDETVALTSNGGTRSKAGIIDDVDEAGNPIVWVGDGPAYDTLVASANLSDVVTPATARANIGANKVSLNVQVENLHGTGVYSVVSPVAGTIKKIWSALQAALATGNAVVTGKINGTNITGGVVTITQAGSAANDIDSATPSAANVVAAGDLISFVVSGTNSADVAANLTIDIET